MRLKNSLEEYLALCPSLMSRPRESALEDFVRKISPKFLLIGGRCLLGLHQASETDPENPNLVKVSKFLDTWIRSSLAVKPYDLEAMGTNIEQDLALSEQQELIKNALREVWDWQPTNDYLRIQKLRMLSNPYNKLYLDQLYGKDNLRQELLQYQRVKKQYEARINLGTVTPSAQVKIMLNTYSSFSERHKAIQNLASNFYHDFQGYRIKTYKEANREVPFAVIQSDNVIKPDLDHIARWLASLVTGNNNDADYLGLVFNQDQLDSLKVMMLNQLMMIVPGNKEMCEYQHDFVRQLGFDLADAMYEIQGETFSSLLKNSLGAAKPVSCQGNDYGLFSQDDPFHPDNYNGEDGEYFV